ncbi:AAA family ATPase [Acidithrix sp. C25]|uniref:DNA repair protein RecN n=1 Tax=Acidithrix sp. C25 TaxID=1671482 RepID=UPI00191BBD06|nr:AAA family ATPase [Acidithrix sp. C25]CAG4905628.1 unnamed protein product [Acidithrix sp. C25]
MLEEVIVENLGVIEEGRLLLEPGMNVISGETGAGKTMVVGAISIATGAKADARWVRVGAQEASVSARFSTPEGEFILSRTILASGRSRSYINGKMASIGELSTLGSSLLDIHGQHDSMKLVSLGAQGEILDRFGGIDTVLKRSLEVQLGTAKRSLAELEANSVSRNRELAIVEFQIREIEKIKLATDDEDLLLEEELDSLEQVEEYRELFGSMIELLEPSEGDSARHNSYSSLARRGGKLRGLEAISARLEALELEVRDLTEEIKGRMDGLEANADRVGEIRSRLVVLRDIKRKYGPSLPEVFSLYESLIQSRDHLQGQLPSPEELESEIATLESEFLAVCKSIKDARTASARLLESGLNALFPKLALGRATCEVALSESIDGSPIHFLFTPNPGQAKIDIAKFASGGELSRFMLAITLLAGAECDTQLFDEVDAGVGGKSAIEVASSLVELSTKRQVIVVTHLPQVAAFAGSHFVITKDTNDFKSRTRIEKVEGASREIEIARMLSGSSDSQLAKEHARELISRYSSK